MAPKPGEELLPSENGVGEKLMVPWKYIYPCTLGLWKYAVVWIAWHVFRAYPMPTGGKVFTPNKTLSGRPETGKIFETDNPKYGH